MYFWDPEDMDATKDNDTDMNTSSIWTETPGMDMDTGHEHGSGHRMDKTIHMTMGIRHGHEHQV